MIGGGQDISALKRYLDECQDLAKNAILDFWKLHVVLLVGFTGLFLLRKALRDKTWLPAFFILSIYACAVWQSYQRGFYLGGERHYCQSPVST